MCSSTQFNGKGDQEVDLRQSRVDRFTVRTNPACLSPSTLGPDCDSGAQFAPQYAKMSSVKLEDCSQTLELNVNIKDEDEEEKIVKSVNHGRLRLTLTPVTSTVRTNPACLSPSTLSPNLQSLG
ncbi:hypothetical protein J4Q44_G00050940, partial [Coregonus suidteri]